MIAHNHESIGFESTLMLLKTTQEMYPLSTFALTVTQSSQRELQRYIGALIVYRDGKVKEITAINKNGFYGNGFKEKFKNILFGSYAISTCLKNVDISFGDIRTQIMDMLVLNTQRDEPIFEIDNTSIVIEKIRAAKDISQIFDLLVIPEPEDCLDVL